MRKNRTVPYITGIVDKPSNQPIPAQKGKEKQACSRMDFSAASIYSRCLLVFRLRGALLSSRYFLDQDQSFFPLYQKNDIRCIFR
jgi:hypothetical protein